MIDPHLEHGPPRTTKRTLRQFAALWLVFCLGIAAWNWFGRDAHGAAKVWAVIGAAVGLPGLVFPEAVRPVFAGLVALTAPIGWLVSHAILGVMYFGILTPIGFVFRLFGRDALALKHPAERKSHWAPHEAPAEADRYMRQS